MNVYSLIKLGKVFIIVAEDIDVATQKVSIELLRRALPPVHKTDLKQIDTTTRQVKYLNKDSY